MQFGRVRPVCPNCGFVQFDDPKVAVIAFVTWDDRVLLIQRGVDPGKGQWALPGGYVDAGEMPDEALRRELIEEVGLSIRNVALLDIFPMVGMSGATTGIVLAYAAQPSPPGLHPLCCQDDVVAAGWFGIDDLPDALAFESTHTLLDQWRETLQQ